MDPSSAAAWVIRGKIEVQLGNESAAVDHFDQAIAVDPNCAEAWYFKGVTLFRGKKFDAKFWRYLERAKQLGDPRAGPLLDRVFQTMIEAERQGKFESARAVSRSGESSKKSPYGSFAAQLMSAPKDQQAYVVREHKATVQSVGFLDWLNALARQSKGDLDVTSLIATLGASLPRQEDPLWISVSSGVTEALSSVYNMELPTHLRYRVVLDRWLLASSDEEPGLIKRYQDVLAEDGFSVWLREDLSGLTKLPQEHAARTLHAPKVVRLAKALAAASSSSRELSNAANAALDSARLLGWT
jgi:tetratricopeptide (TPR) repeat protein